MPPDEVAVVSMTGIGSSSTSIPALVAHNAANMGDRPAVSWMTDGRKTTLTWSGYRAAIVDVASALLDAGVRVGDTVAILATNRVEHLVVDHAITHIRATAVSLYPTLSPDQFQHVLDDSDPKVLVVENDVKADRLRATRWFAERAPLVVCLESDAGRAVAWEDFVARGAAVRDRVAAELDDRVSAAGLTDTATVIYTSGTTGAPKGVALTTGNVLWNADAMVEAGFVDYEYSAVCYLPLAHIVERLWSIYLAARTGGHVHCCPDPGELMAALREHRPAYFMAVPRVWEKLAGAVDAIIASSAFDGRRDQVEQDRAALGDLWDVQVSGGHPSPVLLMEAERARRNLRDVRVLLGLDRAHPSSAAAALKPATARHFASVGMTIVQGYGLSETAGPVAVEPWGQVSDGSVGILLPDYEARIAEDGEILLRGPGNIEGYRNRPEATAELLDADGWLRTGDVGRIDEAGRLYVTDRKKELIITAAGKNIAPQAVENELAGRSFIAQVVAVGDGRPYVAALITPDEARLAAFAAERGLADLPPDQLVEHPVVLAEAAKHVEEANAALSRPEQIKRFRLLASPFTVEEGTLTPTFKFKRRIVQARFSEEINGLYDVPVSQAPAGAAVPVEETRI